MDTSQSNRQYFIEFSGDAYVVFLGLNAVAAFATIDDAFAAKHRFENRPNVSDFDKTPPAMRFDKQRFYG